VKVGLTLVFLMVVLVAVLAWRTWTEGAAAIVTDFGRLPGEVSFTLMLSAIGAAGAGGVHNLILSNWIRDKRYGMGAHVRGWSPPSPGPRRPAAPAAGTTSTSLRMNPTSRAGRCGGSAPTSSTS
jgi:hypothetical protein